MENFNPGIGWGIFSNINMTEKYQWFVVNQIPEEDKLPEDLLKVWLFPLGIYLDDTYSKYI